MKKSKILKRLIALGAVAVMTFSLAFSASAASFTDVYLPAGGAVKNLASETLVFNSTCVVYRFTMLSSNSPVTYGVKDTKSGKTLCYDSTSKPNSVVLDYGTTIAKGTNLTAYARNSLLNVSQYVSGTLAF